MSSSTVYVIGDVHGCYKSLKSLLNELPKDARFIFLGDTINRGPASLDCLKLIMNMGNKATYILGNHELHCLAVAVGARELSKKDTFTDILNAKEASHYIEWLRKRPLAHFDEKLQTLFVHAGVHPSWTIPQALSYAQEVQKFLGSPNWGKEMKSLFGNEPCWNPLLTGKERLRAIMNVLTRSRFVYLDGKLEFKNNDSPDTAPFGLYPWFDHPHRQSAGKRIVSGHWSTCGLTIRKDLITLDTGCCWGQELTAIRLPKIRVWQVDGLKKSN